LNEKEANPILDSERADIVICDEKHHSEKIPKLSNFVVGGKNGK
jgi:hypothetical protein